MTIQKLRASPDAMLRALAFQLRKRGYTDTNQPNTETWLRLCNKAKRTPRWHIAKQKPIPVVTQ